MVIDTQQSFSGFIAANPQLSQTERGDARFYARVGHEHYRRNEDGSFTRLDTTFHHLLIFGRAAERAYAVFKRGDRFIAEGHLRNHGSREEFVAKRIGHDSAQTPYTVYRGTRSRPHRPTLEREPGVDLASVRDPASAVGRSPASRDYRPPSAFSVGGLAVDRAHGGHSGITRIGNPVVATIPQRGPSTTALSGDARERVR